MAQSLLLPLAVAASCIIACLAANDVYTAGTTKVGCKPSWSGNGSLSCSPCKLTYAFGEELYSSNWQHVITGATSRVSNPANTCKPPLPAYASAAGFPCNLGRVALSLRPIPQVELVGKSPNFLVYPNTSNPDVFLMMKFSKLEEREVGGGKVNIHSITSLASAGKSSYLFNQPTCQVPWKEGRV